MSPQARAQIEHECQRLQVRYCLTADRRDVEGFVSLFTPDAFIKVPEHPPFAGHDAIRAAIIALGQTGIESRHVMTNPLIEVEGADAASGWCYLTVYNSAAKPNAEGQWPIDLPATVGEYEDAFARTPGGWRFKARTLTRVFRRMEDPMIAAARAAQKS